MTYEYKGKQCAYCGLNNSTDREHVFARGFFLERDRANLPQVAACNGCNVEKNKAENYLMNIMPLGARHGSGLENKETLGLKRLQKNVKVQKVVAASAPA